MKDLKLHPNDRRLVMILRALGNPARVLILNEVRRLGACPAGSLADRLPLSQSTISEHLRRLREAGIITGESGGTPTIYRLNEETMAWLREQLEAAFDPAMRAGSAVDEYSVRTLLSSSGYPVIRSIACAYPLRGNIRIRHNRRTIPA